jgi:hypothetical protein
MISAESKQIIASALYRDAREWEGRAKVSDRYGIETANRCRRASDVCSELCSALLELGCDTDELRWVHDKIAAIAAEAAQHLEAAANA